MERCEYQLFLPLGTGPGFVACGRPATLRLTWAAEPGRRTRHRMAFCASCAAEVLRFPARDLVLIVPLS